MSILGLEIVDRQDQELMRKVLTQLRDTMWPWVPNNVTIEIESYNIDFDVYKVRIGVAGHKWYHRHLFDLEDVKSMRDQDAFAEELAKMIVKSWLALREPTHDKIELGEN